ncbi:hypothetical protein [Laribacter hongkongensis]|uniref:Uncharacterized protein n=1 Tax=Laribacter hongkongensis TaxID=168471 RepID=A0ABD4SX60_9NEIS|nr:hypothetical protein [Laribacter hongkongensis]MCG9027269.1 hypothetical protein [Laribacter hongkongensis]
MNACVRNAREAVGWVLDTMADNGQAIASHQLAIELERLLDRRLPDLSIHDIRTIAGAVAALNLAPPMLGPIARSSESAARDAMQNGEQARELTIGGLIHGYQ